MKRKKKSQLGGLEKGQDQVVVTRKPRTGVVVSTISTVTTDTLTKSKKIKQGQWVGMRVGVGVEYRWK